uniref:homocysteine S-methyltransferase YbgG-like isoform X2 n=1 Tax=Myxine glutinosa TaxID=7769 RepID=UPI00358FF58D
MVEVKEETNTMCTLRDDVKILDGGLCTDLAAHGYRLQGDALWGSGLLKTNPEAVKQAHLRFLRCGADVISTATYQASIQGFVQQLGLGVEESTMLLQQGVHLAKQAVSEYQATQKHSERRPTTVAGSLGPYGAFLLDCSEYTGNYVDGMSEEELMAWQRPKVAALLAGGVDVLAFDTIPSQREATAMARLLREFPEASAWLSFSCKDSMHTSHGEPILQAADSGRICDEQLLGIGVNCCSPHLVTGLLTALADAPKHWRRVVYPNSGEVWNHQHGLMERKGSRSLISYSKEWRDLGATWIGGCCHVTPQDISDLRKTLLPLTPVPWARDVPP